MIFSFYDMSGYVKKTPYFAFTSVRSLLFKSIY